eukprot:CAMPEP_0171314350 /NCGR_PEP_ID=MMETSP0816-20121228/50662_1 /TAXON_ID=420281 /ORGANISM="Proboscia inermis, Strain CCAP1064/1" /LENGTH=46 /DNA_ID= /DNA_START= /DNA_END= /DNA_ORIENTATION=
MECGDGGTDDDTNHHTMPYLVQLISTVEKYAVAAGKRSGNLVHPLL